MEYVLSRAQYVGKAETAFNIRLSNHRKDVSNPKSIPADLHFRKPGHSFNPHAKFTLIEQLVPESLFKKVAEVIFTQQITTP